MSEVKLKIDIKNGTVEIEANGELFEKVSEKAGALLDKFAKIDFQGSAPSETGESHEREARDDSDENNQHPPEQKVKKRRASGSARSTNWKMVDNLLDEAGRHSLKAFFEEKMPSGQNEQVAVLTVKLKELTSREGFDGDEIHTAFQIVGKKTPGNLNAVFGNMATAGLGSQSDKKFKPNFKAGDLVKHDLPRKVDKK